MCKQAQQPVPGRQALLILSERDPLHVESTEGQLRLAVRCFEAPPEPWESQLSLWELIQRRPEEQDN